MRVDGGKREGMGKQNRGGTEKKGVGGRGRTKKDGEGREEEGRGKMKV